MAFPILMQGHRVNYYSFGRRYPVTTNSNFWQPENGIGAKIDDLYSSRYFNYIGNSPSPDNDTIKIEIMYFFQVVLSQ